MRNLILFAGLLLELAQAIAPPMPSPTDPLVGGVNLRGFTPKPTEAPTSPFELKKRGSSPTSNQFLGWFAPDNTCGYVDGLLDASKTCSMTQLCAALEFEGVATMGCCDIDDNACTWLGNCVGYNGYYSSSLCDEMCQNDINTMKCTDIASPYCYSYMIPGISVGWFSCASTFYSEFVDFETTWAGENDGRTWSKVYNTLGTSNGLDTSLTDISTNAFLDGTIAPISSTGGSAGTSTPKPSPKSSTPVGAIVGGVVGGLAAIGAIVGLIVFLLLRRRKPQNQPTANGGVTTVGGAPSQGPGPNMAQPQTQSVYGAPNDYQPQQEGQGLSASYYAAGKQDYSPNAPQGAFGGGAAAKIHGGPQVQHQEAQPPLSPAPPYSQPAVPAGGVSPVGSPPPNIQELNAANMRPQYPPQQGTQQPMGGVAAIGGPPPGMQYHGQQVQELPTQYATTLHTVEGQPIYEAPDQVYRSAPQ